MALEMLSSACSFRAHHCNLILLFMVAHAVLHLLNCSVSMQSPCKKMLYNVRDAGTGSECVIYMQVDLPPINIA